MRLKTTAILFSMAGILAACGDTTGERAIFGGAAGAGAAVVLDTNPITGAAIGAAGNLIYCDKNPDKC